MELERILFINLDRIGDTVRSTFLIRALRKNYPRAYLAVLAASPSDQILERDPHVDEVFSMPHRQIRESMDNRETILQMSFPVFSLFEELRSHSFDLVINPFSEFGAMTVRYIKPRYMLGRAVNTKGEFVIYGRETAAFFYCMTNTHGTRSANQLNFNDLYARIVKDIGISIEQKEMYPCLYPAPSDQAEAEDFFCSQGVQPDAVCIGFQIGAYVKQKMWPVHKFRSIAEMLQKEYGAKIILTGSPHEAQTIIKEMIGPMKIKPAVAAGRMSIMGSAALISRCDCFISNDTGPMHIAASLGIPVIALFGLVRTIPEESYPWGEQNTVLVQPAIEDIPVEAVCEAVRKRMDSLLARSQQGGE